MWMPTLGHSSNHKGYNDSYRYNHKDCNRTPTAQATGLKDGKRQFHRKPWNWHLQSLRSVWDCQHHADQSDTFTPSHMERWCDRGSRRTHRTMPLRENTSLNQDHIKTNRMEEFPYLLWRTKRLRTERGRVWDAPTTIMGNPDPGTSLPVYTQDTVPVDLVRTMVAHVFWGSKDTYHLWY